MKDNWMQTFILSMSCPEVPQVSAQEATLGQSSSAQQEK